MNEKEFSLKPVSHKIDRYGLYQLQELNIKEVHMRFFIFTQLKSRLVNLNN
jgi:hypothetical protein